VSIVGLQWGDEGKGKVVDYVADRFDAVARFNGGSNAGHTVVVGGRRHTFHLIPSGALSGKKELLIGAGVALDPEVLAEELQLLPSDVRRRLTVDHRCSLVSPLEKELDKFLEEMRGSSSIGTTKRGIGPSYAMRALRLTPRVTDIMDAFDFGGASEFYSRLGIESAGLLAWAEESKKALKGMVGDAGSRVSDITGSGGSVLFEGSQGALLDLLHGSYPFVTSTHTIATYIPTSMGIAPKDAGTPLGVMKCYTTRVGGGPFPTELKGQLGDNIRSLGSEYGATTGRPRRVGWLDLVALKYAVKLNGVSEVAVSKLDVLSQVKDFRVCVAYRYDGSETTDFLGSLSRLGEVEPVYMTPLQLYGTRYDSGMPKEARLLVEYIENELKVRVKLISYGEERSKTIEL
jgi:adenylosuccinate synthase